jgi:hypothetical protein
MQIFVRSIDNTFVVNLAEDATLADLKAQIEDKEFLPAGVQRIVKGSTALTEANFGEVAEADEVALLLDVSGGMRAKWRKKRMRRLRRKRRKMRQRAR